MDTNNQNLAIENSIDDEIENFINELYEKIETVLQKELQFIQTNHLRIPKENYLFLFDFLNSLIHTFIKIDYEVESALVKKLYVDIESLTILYDDYKNIHIDIYKIFNKNFLQYSNILQHIKLNLKDKNDIKN